MPTKRLVIETRGICGVDLLVRLRHKTFAARHGSVIRNSALEVAGGVRLAKTILVRGIIIP